MKRVFSSTFFSFALFLVLQAAAGSASSETHDPTGIPRLFYSFSVRVPEQCDRACLLQEMIRPYRLSLRVVGVVRDGGSPERAAEGLEEFRRRHDLAYPILDLSAALAEPGLPVEIRSWLEQAEDRVLLQGGDGRTLVTGTVEEMAELLAAFVPLPTDVDESTWGKVKELFQ